MPEILIISNEQCILEIVAQLRAQLDADVDIVKDFSQGLKEIFFRQPAVVFVQHEIGGIPGEKVASQVRALLEGEPIRLVLLSRGADQRVIDDSNFDDSIDISLPSRELVRQIQQHVYNALFTDREKPDIERQIPPDETEIAELMIHSPEAGNEYKINSLADVFPTPFPYNWNLSLTRDADTRATPEPSNLYVESITPYKEISFDEEPSRGSLSTLTGDSTADASDPLILTGADLFNGTPKSPGISTQGSSDDMGQLGVNGVTERQGTLSVESNGGSFNGLMSSPTDATVPIKSVEGGSIGEVPLASTACLEVPRAIIPSLLEMVGKEQPSYPTTDQIPLRQSVVQDDALSWSGGISADAGDEDYPFRQDLTKKYSFLYKMLIGSLILAIIVIAFLLAKEWWGWGEQETVRVIPRVMPAAAQWALPAFIPRVAPDSAYAAAHPDWERREADGIEYLIFRERGRIKAIQIVAGANGVIAASLLKTCIRETTGLDNLGNWVRERRDNFLVEKGTMPNKGELAVYRKMPEGDIRGLVIVYY